MESRQACFNCIHQDPPALLEALMWLTVEHCPLFDPQSALQRLDELRRQAVTAIQPDQHPSEQAQILVQQLIQAGFAEDSERPLKPRSILMSDVMERQRAHHLVLAIIVLDWARKIGNPLVGINFPGRFLLRIPTANHLLDPANGRCLYTRDCKNLLMRVRGTTTFGTEDLAIASEREILIRLSRQLRQLYMKVKEPMHALTEAERIFALHEGNSDDHLVRADIYHQLQCPQAERHDLQFALLLSEDPVEQWHLTQRLKNIQPDSYQTLH